MRLCSLSIPPRLCTSTLLNIKLKEVSAELVFNESVVLHCTTDGGSLFHPRVITLVKKTLVQSEFIRLHIKFYAVISPKRVIDH